MELDLSNLNPPTWFDHPHYDETRILLRVASAEKLEEIRKQTIRRVDVFKRGQRFEKEVVDEVKQSELIWVYCICDWQGLTDKKTGDAIPCTDENKVLLVRGNPQFAGWINDCLEILNEDGAERLESAEKNSSSTHSE